MSNNGFVIVASLSKAYYYAALNLAESIKDHYPNARITFFTHKDFLNTKDFDDDLFEKIITPIPIHRRAKLWALFHTPYEITAYIDADTVCIHSDIQYIFDELTDEYDIATTRIVPYATYGVKTKYGDMNNHGGIIIYRDTDQVLDFMREWWIRYHNQVTKPEWNYLDSRNEFAQWDQYTLLHMLRENYNNIRMKTIDDMRWNYVSTHFLEGENNEEVVLDHAPIHTSVDHLLLTIERHQKDVFA